jgi:hypothetical protein
MFMQLSPNVFEVSIGGWPLWYSVSLNSDGTLLHKTMQDGEEPIEVISPPSSDAWRRFLRTCTRIHINKWKTQYESDSFVCDGTHWHFDIQFPELTYKGEGDNAYPIGFKTFCAAVRRLVCGLEFS